MSSDKVDPSKLRQHPTNPNWTDPKSYGVWELPIGSSGKRYRFGNNPVREIELKKEFGNAKLVALFLNRNNARQYAKELDG